MKKTILLLAGLPAIALLAAFSMRSHTSFIPAKSGNEEFQAFLKQFKPADLPFSMTAKQLQKQMTAALDENLGKVKRKKERLEDPEGFLPFDRMSMISRMPTYREPEVQLANAENIVVIYSVSRGFSRPFKSYVAAVFDKKGNALASHRIAETNSEYLSAFSIDARLQATIQSYRINWKENDDELYDHREIAGLTPETSKIVDLTQADDKEFEDFPKAKPAKKLDVPNGASLGAVIRH